MLEILIVAAKTYLLIGFVLAALSLSGHVRLVGADGDRDLFEGLERMLDHTTREKQVQLSAGDRAKVLRFAHFCVLLLLLVLWLPMSISTLLR